MSTSLLEPTTAPPTIVSPMQDTVSSGQHEPYQAAIITELAAFEAIGTQWDAFMRETGTRNLCLTHTWLSSWLRNFPPARLLVIVVSNAQGQWVGAAPLMIRRSPTGLFHRMLHHVQFIGTMPTVYDWMKIVIRPGADESRVLQSVASALKSVRWDVLDLQFLPDKPQMEQLCAALRMGRVEAAIRETMPIPYIPALPTTVAEYEKVRRKKTRLEVNRHSNRFEKEFGHPPVLEFQPACKATDAILTRFFSGHIQYWAERGQKSDFHRFPNLYPFYKQMLAHAETVTDPSTPKLLFSVLKVADYQLSYHLGFWQGDGYLCHITNFNQGFRSYSPGTIHMDALVFDTIRRGGIQFEFGRGDEPYKTMWTKEKKTLWSLRLFRNSLAAGLWQVDILLKRLMRKPAE